MTFHEIHKEVLEDIKNIQNKIEKYQNEFKRIVLKSNHYPLKKSYVCTTPEKKNVFIVEFTALKRSSWKKPLLNLYGIYSRPEGKYAVSSSLEVKSSIIYPPHFFKRYRERIIKDESLSNEEIIKLYFKDDWGFMAAIVNEDFESIYHCFEKDDKNDKISIVAATSQGYCFGEKQGNVSILKTIITEEMLFENQKHTFSSLKTAFQESLKKRYGPNDFSLPIKFLAN